MRVHSAGLLLFFVKKSHNEERKVLSTSLFIRYTLRDCFARCSSEARVLLLKKIQFVRSERLEDAKPIRRVSMRKPDLRIEEISWLDFVFSLTFFSIAQEVSDEDVRCVHCMHVGAGFGVGSSWSEGKELQWSQKCLQLERFQRQRCSQQRSSWWVALILWTQNSLWHLEIKCFWKIGTPRLLDYKAPSYIN